MKKVICIIFIYTLLLLSGTDLSADQKFLDNGNGHYNGYGYGHGYDIGNGPSNGNGYGHNGTPPGNNAPEPISSALFILGGAGLALYKKSKNN